MTFLLPPILENEQGDFRRVGFELEFGGISMEDAASILQRRFGGEIVREGRYRCELKGTPWGDFGLEVDSIFLKENRYEIYFEKMGLDPASSKLAHGVEETIEALAGSLVPLEIVSPPLPIHRMECIEQFREELFRNSAKGTKANWYAAFGMQFNPEVPDRRPETILSYLRAFFLLYDWLYQESDVALARRLSPYIHEFPKDYVAAVLDPGYAPDLDELMHDYLKANPTRNRPLDLLPLWADINPDLLFRYPVEKDLVKARPTFHYRLPNSQVDDPQWSIARDWNNWVEVERLACSPERLREMTESYLETKDGHALFTKSKWVEKAREWLSGDAL